MTSTSGRRRASPVADIGTLADQYRRSARIASKLNDALIPVKRHSVLHRVRANDRLRDAQQTLAKMARSFAEVIETDSSNLPSLEWPDGQPPAHVVLDAVRQAAARQRPDTVEDLRAAADHLEAGKELSADELAALELIADATGKEAAEAYRRLMRV